MKALDFTDEAIANCLQHYIFSRSAESFSSFYTNIAYMESHLDYFLVYLDYKLST